MTKIDKSDWKYVNVDPDPDFDPEHNKRVIDNVIKSNEKIYRQKERDRKDRMGERTQAIASYVKSVVNDKSNTTPEQYFGKRYLTKLRGQQIIDILRNEQKA